MTPEREEAMRDVISWLRAAPKVSYMAHNTVNGVGLAKRERPMYANELADELERQVLDGTA